MKGRAMRAASLLTVIVAFLFSINPTWGQNSITGLRTGNFDGTARLVIETLSETEISVLLLSNPYRLVIDMPDVKWRIADKGASGTLQTPPLRGYRYGVPAPDISRLVIDLDGPAVPVRAFRLAPSNSGYRIIIDLKDRGETAFQLAARALRENRSIPLEVNKDSEGKQGQVAMLMPLPRPERREDGRDESGQLMPLPRPFEKIPDRTGRWVVFIDAGHGGKDPGAIGLSGIKEKEITLKAARELEQLLTASGKVRVVLSRDGDIYHKLRHRISLARAEKADVFISLHADAAHNKKAKGVSVFTLSDTASDKEAERLASRENKADLIGGPDLATTDPDIGSALLSMFQRESMNQSSVLAAHILQEFEGLPTPRRGHRFAGFAVLKSPDVPSVLIEMGFLTNKADERNLKKSTYRRDLMQRLTRAVLRYLETSNLPALEKAPS
ncbi:MAG: N-acetylmuramoyl-L-alanine amidase [Alphaproteobacteria bacterium]|nr:N-acetylmuramoyl-L-alanine amidase [Alphaproteobacteria bacterium]